VEIGRLVALAALVAVAARFGVPDPRDVARATPVAVVLIAGTVLIVGLGAKVGVLRGGSPIGLSTRWHRAPTSDLVNGPPAGDPTSGRTARKVLGVAAALAVAVVVAVRSDADRAALEQPDALGSVEGVAWVVSDPVRGDFGVRTVLRIDGRRYWTQVPPQWTASVRDLLVGDRVVVSGRTSAFDDARTSWRWSRHLAGVLRVDTVQPGPPPPVWIALPNAIRSTLVAGASGFDEQRRALYLGLVVGDDRDQSDLDRFRFRASGLGHLLAVSGQNVSLVLASAAPLLWRLPRRARPWAGAAVVLVFVIVTRAEPSVLRASVMAVVVLLATSVGRVAGGVRAVAWAVVILLFVDPLLIHSVGFVLSVAATLGLAVGSEPISRRLRGPRWWRELVGASLAAQLATLPVQLSVFGLVPVVSLMANVLAVPAAGVVVVFGATVGLAAGLAHPSVADVVMYPVGLVVGWIDLVATWCSRLPLTPLDPSRTLAVLGVGTMTWWAWRHRRARLAATSIAGVIVIAVVLPVAPGVGRHDLGRAAVLDVHLDGRRVVATAPGASALDVLESLWRLGVVSADQVVGPPASPAATAVAEHFRCPLDLAGSDAAADSAPGPAAVGSTRTVGADG